MAEYKVKGTHIIQARNWVDARMGEGTFNRFIKDLDITWHQPILPTAWCDVEDLQKILVRASVHTRLSVEAISTQVAVANAKTDLTSVYRAFLRLAGPHLTMQACTTLWHTYCSFADVKVIKNERGYYLADGVDIPQSLLSWACGTWRGFLPTAVELSGGKNVTSEVVSKRRQEENDLWSFRFEMKYD